MHFAKEPEGDDFEEMIAEGLSQLGRSADGTLQVYLNLFLPVSTIFAIIHNIFAFKYSNTSDFILFDWWLFRDVDYQILRAYKNMFTYKL